MKKKKKKKAHNKATLKEAQETPRKVKSYFRKKHNCWECKLSLPSC